MKNWIKINEKEENEIWDKIYNDLKFKPSVHPNDWPSLQISAPYMKYDVSDIYKDNKYEELYKDLEEKMENIFVECTKENEYVLALDWQHQCYYFNPRIESIRDEFGEWPVPIFPNGDYYFFIQKEFKWGFLGHPWEKSISIFGEELIQSIEQKKPKLFKKIVDKNF